MALLGCGNMGKAILDRILATLEPSGLSSRASKSIQHDHIGLSRFIACVSRPESVAALEDRYRPYLDQSATTSTRSSANGHSHSPTVSVWRNDNAKAVASADVILLACQPRQVGSILSDSSIRQHLQGKLLISICVGVSAARIHSLLSADAADRHGVDATVGTPKKATEHGCYIVHAMPSTASRLGQSATVLSTGSSTPGVSSPPLPPTLQALVTSIFRCIGTTTFVPAELMNAASVVGASTPAFFATVLDGIVKGGVRRGLSESDALSLAAQAMKGTAEIVLRGMESGGKEIFTPTQIKESVMTPNGCTERGVKTMAAHGVEEAMTDATSQAIDRVFQLEQDANK